MRLGLHEKPCLAAAGTADDKNILVSGVSSAALGRLFIISRSVCVRMHIVVKHRVNERLDVLPLCPMKRFVKCFFELLTQIIVKVRKCKAQRVCVLHFQLAGSGGCFFLMKLYH